MLNHFAVLDRYNTALKRELVALLLCGLLMLNSVLDSAGVEYSITATVVTSLGLAAAAFYVVIRAIFTVVELKQ